ncbi:hypothetical protein RB195_023653 [Necator americanus]|uniref:Reverse transcriptase domain-containing protein n=1 Tax=Necator americanus TaxID=51031 RepID=A0ABR1EMF6_NECAM
MPLCLTFIDLKKAFDSVETEAVMEALDNQGVPTLYIKVLRELHNKFTTGISPFYKNIIIDVKREVRQGDTISPKIFTATIENAMRKLEWDDMGVKVDGRQLHHLRFADDIVLIIPIGQAERMLNADRIRRNMHRSSAESTNDDVHAERMDLGCPIHAQRNEHIRMHQLRLSGLKNKHEERPDPRAGQEKRLGERTRASRM